MGWLCTTPGSASSNPTGDELEYLGTSALNLKIFRLGVENGEEDDDGEELAEFLPPKLTDLSGVAGGGT